MVNPKNIIKLNCKDYILYTGLLEEAHRKGLKSVETEIVQIPNEINSMTAIVKCTLEGSNGEVFSDYGDASPASVNAKLAPHLLRMASTRAKARTMRDFCDIGMCSFEELNPEEMDIESATLSQISLVKKLSAELSIQVDCNDLTKDSASRLINELSEKKKARNLKLAK